MPVRQLVTIGSLVAGHQRFGVSAVEAALRCVEATPARVGSAAAVHRFVDAACKAIAITCTLKYPTLCALPELSLKITTERLIPGTWARFTLFLVVGGSVFGPFGLRSHRGHHAKKENKKENSKRIQIRCCGIYWPRPSRQ